MKKYLFIVYIFISCSIYGQNNYIDSLGKILLTAKEDSIKVKVLNEIGYELLFSNPDTAKILFDKALELAKKIDWKHGEASAFSNIGLVFHLKGDYKKAIEYHTKSLYIDKAIGYKKGYAKQLVNIGLAHYYLGDYPKVLDYYLQALKIDEDRGDKNAIASTLTNIGIVYYTQGSAANDPKEKNALFNKALKNYYKALDIHQGLENKDDASSILANIGVVYYEQAATSIVIKLKEELFPKALDYFTRALIIKEELGDKVSMAGTLCNIGNIYNEQGAYSTDPEIKNKFYTTALDYFFKALKIKEELGDKNGMAINLGNIGNAYMAQKKYGEAEKYLLQALSIDKEIESQNGERMDEIMLSELYEKMNNYQKALEHYKNAMVLQDSIFSQENREQLIQKEMNFDFEKKEAIAKAEHNKELEKQEAVAAEKEREAKIIIYSVIGGLLLVIIFAGFIFRSLRVTRKQKQIIEIKNKETEHQKKIIEEKQKEITDSITYALRIQEAILPLNSELQKVLPQSFVLYKPKDIVAGDFYWMHEGEVAVAVNSSSRTAPATATSSILLAAADCTGHGVPGAFTSMICSEKLNDAVKQSYLPNEILSLVNKGIKKSLRQNENKEAAKDGMDIALCSIDLQNGLVNYAGANRPLWIIRKDSMLVEEIKATKKAIGGFTEDEQIFELHTIELKQGDTIYLTTDGYADQNGGAKGKKLMTKTMKQILLDIQNNTMQEQKTHLENFIEEWKAETEQLDDILVIGVRFS